MERALGGTRSRGCAGCSNVGVVFKQIFEEADLVAEITSRGRNKFGREDIGHLVSVQTTKDKTHRDMELSEVKFPTIIRISECPYFCKILARKAALAKDLERHLATDKPGAAVIPSAEDLVVVLLLVACKLPGDARSGSPSVLLVVLLHRLLE